MLVGVAYDKFITGASGPNSLIGDTPVEALTCMPLGDALQQEWDTDAHFVPYSVRGEEQWPRLQKEALAWVEQSGGVVESKYLVLELDNPDHKTWAELGLDQQQTLLESLMRCAEDEPLLAQWKWFYFSAGGCRMIYELDEPVPVLTMEDHWRWLAHKWRSAGFDGAELVWEADPNVSDWTRLWRLPRVMRDGVATGDQEYFEIIEMDQIVKIADLGKADRVSTALRQRESVAIDAEMPEPEECDRLMWGPPGANRKPTDWNKLAKRKLRGRECYPTLFEGLALSDGSRDSTLTRYVGQVISLLLVLEQCTPERVYALFYETLCQLEPDSGTPDWFSSCWGKVKRFYAQEISKAAASAEVEVAKTQEQVLSVGDRMVQGMRNWSAARPLFTDTATAIRWMSRRMIALTGQSMYLMGPNGRYEPLPLADRQLIPRLRVSHLAPWVKTTRVTDAGESDLTVPTILNAHSTVVRRIVGIASGSEGAHIEGMDSQDATMYVPLYTRNPNLKPQYDQDVDDWLRAFFGPDYELGCRWIGHALAFEEGPIAALSIKGGAGAGKQMLVQGLAECLKHPATAGAEDLVEAYSYGLLESPFLVINEGWPKRSRFTQHPSDVFRKLVAGDGMMAQRKYEAPIQVKVPVRILFTANNLDVVKELSYGKTLSPEDRDAIGARLIHLDIKNEASKWLEQRGGLQFTSVPGRRWLAPASGAARESDYILAKHFLYLYESRGEQDPGRFLIMGRKGDSIIQQMRVESGLIPLVAESIVRMTEAYKPGLPISASRAPGMKGIYMHQETGRLYVTSSGVEEYYRENLFKVTSEKIKNKDVVDALHTLAIQIAEYSWTPDSKACGKKRWHEIDVPTLLQVVDSNGWDAPNLCDLLLRQKDAGCQSWADVETAQGLLEKIAAAREKVDTEDA